MRLAHITDIHMRHSIPGHAAIPRRRSREAFGLLRRAVADARRRGAEILLVTGDIVDVPGYLFDSEHPATGGTDVWRAVRRDYRLVRETLDGSGLPWIALPGNHDSFLIMEEELGAAPYVRDHGDLRFVSFWDRELRGHVPQRIHRERFRLDSVLQDPDPRPQVHLQHFVITPRLDRGYPHTYREGEEIQQRLTASRKVALALSGHYHPGCEVFRADRTTFSVTPALVESPHPYRLFDVRTHDGGGVTVCTSQVNLVPDAGPCPAVFLDRDGCIDTPATYRAGPGCMELLPTAAGAIRLLRNAGYKIVVVTNQSCGGRGYVSPDMLETVHDRMCRLLADEGAHVDAVYASLDAGKDAVAEKYRATGDSKPSPAMLHRAQAELCLDLSASHLVGTRQSGLDAARAAGVHPILVRTGDRAKTEHAWTGRGACDVVDDLGRAARLILDRSTGVADGRVGPASDAESR